MGAGRAFTHLIAPLLDRATEGRAVLTREFRTRRLAGVVVDDLESYHFHIPASFSSTSRRVPLTCSCAPPTNVSLVVHSVGGASGSTGRTGFSLTTSAGLTAMRSPFTVSSSTAI